MLRPRWRNLSASLLLLLTACGGGGGGGGGSAAPASANPSPGPAATYTVSGTITLPDTAAVDSDTNDAQQVGRASNNTAGTAQLITTPVQLVGTVNMAGAGPTGANLVAGDAFDFFQVSLVQGQVIELSFVGDTSSTNVDLILTDSNSNTTVGTSISTTSSSECITVGTSGNYYVTVWAVAGAAPYNLRIGAPGETSCPNTSTSTEVMALDQLIAKPSNKASTSTVNEVQRAASLQTLDGSGHERARLMRLPYGKERRMRGIEQLGQWRRGGKNWRAHGIGQLFDLPDSHAQHTFETLQYARHLMETGLYEYVEPNFAVQSQAVNQGTGEPQYLPQRWHYEQINQPAAVDRIEGLAYALGRTRPLVAVIDTGIVDDHPDLQAQIEGGYSFISTNTPGDGDTNNGNDPSQINDNTFWHGTHVAGTIAAVSDNRKYGAGVAPMAKLMPLRVFSPRTGLAYSYDIVQAIRYASGQSNRSGGLPARKADVINLSLGSQSACFSQYASEIAAARAQGVVVVASAGNKSTSVSSPANCPGVIAVGATDALRHQTWYSNFGPELKLVAPGGDPSRTTTGTGYVDSIFSALGAFDSSGVRTPSFGQLAGTSMAAPHVAGVIALMRYIHPGITPAQIDSLIVSGSLSDDINGVGRDDATGYGLINARKAVEEALILAGGGAAPNGIVLASPASISFGSLTTGTTFELKTTASTTETVTSVTSSNPAAIIVSPFSIDASTKLGTYNLVVDRSQLPPGTSYPTVTVVTSARTFTIQLTVIKLASLSAPSLANYGRVIVRVQAAGSGTSLGQVSVNVSNGQYVWSIPGIPAGAVNIIAGTNLDNDNYFCEQGEVCGRYPDISSTLYVGSNMSGVNFVIAPTGIAGATALGAGGVLVKTP